MRNIINISLPEKMAKEIRQEVRAGDFASTSEFIRHLIRHWNTEKLAKEIRSDRKSFERGKGKILYSFKDLR